MPTSTILSFFRPIAPRPAPRQEKPGVEKEKDVKTTEAPQQRQQSKRETRPAICATPEPSVPQSGNVNTHGDGEEDEQTAAGETSEGVSEYEQKRLARMAENAAFLAQLGMKNAQFALASQKQGGSKPNNKQQKVRIAAKRKRAVLATNDDGDGGLRRSSRLRKLPVDDSAQKPEPSNDVEKRDDAEMLDVFFDDSSVLRYTCQAPASSVDSSDNGATATEPGHAPPLTERSLVGFELEDHREMPPLFDPKLKRIYAVSFSPFAENGLLVTAGHQGHVSIYAAHSPSPNAVDDEQGPLLSFKAHKGWISSVSLAKSSPGGQRNLLLTASNDTLLKLWDLNQVTVLSTSKSASVPKIIFQMDKLHSAGIFSMDVLHDSVATCSKDSTVAISQFRDGSSLPVIHRYADQHDGVVKSVRFSRQKPRQVASGGNDRVLRVFDTNIKDRAVIEVRDAHARAINSVQFHPTDANLLTSAGFDADMHLFDLRRPSTPLFTFCGHLVDGKQQSAIYHPVFVDSGRGLAAAAGAQCRHISLYNVQDGRTVSRGAIPYRPDVFAADPFADRLLVASGGSIEFYRFKWK